MTDIHQHLWPPAFIDALRARAEAPRLDGWRLVLPDERPYSIDPSDHDPARRAAAAAAEGDERICISPAASLGLDRLDPAVAAELAEAWLDGALALGAPFAAWAMAGVLEPDAAALRDALDRGALGLELAADVLAAPDALERLAPLLEVLDNEGAALLVHPGPAGAQDDPGRPGWWAPVVPYVSQLHAAWWAWADGGRERFPDLPVCFAALAGLGPLHGERQRARGGDSGAVDPLTFVETSCYGTLAVDAVIRVLGVDVICHGTDRPYCDAAPLALGEAALNAIKIRNPGRLLARHPDKVPT